METELTYDQIYKTLYSEKIEKFVPDGISISHPVLDINEGKIVDCFLLYATSRDFKKYSSPIARIIISPENKKLIEYQTTKEKPFFVYDGIDYYLYDNPYDENTLRKAEEDFQESYMEIRKIAFKNNITAENKKTIVRNIQSLKIVEYKQLQPFLFELGQPFFLWVKTML